MAGGFDNVSHKEAVRLVLCSRPKMDDTLLKCKMTAHGVERVLF